MNHRRRKWNWNISAVSLAAIEVLQDRGVVAVENSKFVYRLALWAGLCLFSVLYSHEVSATDRTEYQIKAAYLYQLTQFVEWPTAVFEVSDPAFRFCVLGEDPIGKYLKPLTERTHNGLPIILDYLQSVSEAHGCHLLYIATSGARRETMILNKYKNVPLLTVSSRPGFAVRGGVIGFAIIDKRVRLEINRAAARRANIKLSAKLLEVAIVIKDNPSQENLP